MKKIQKVKQPPKGEIEKTKDQSSKNEPRQQSPILTNKQT